jgi:ribosomal-protein-alanine N-acetyltransferase
VNTATATPAVRARLTTWPDDPATGHVVLLDHAMCPDDADVAGWLATSHARGHRRLRTGALFPPSAAPFRRAGFRRIDELTLLQLDLGERRRRRGPSLGRATRTVLGRGPTRRMSSGELTVVAALDQRCFAAPWGNDRAGLRAMQGATPTHRSRTVRRAGTIVGFAIAGRAGRTGYLQRLAVDPSVRRQGVALALLDDACDWMARRGATSVMVNTATTNRAALGLYTTYGFRCRDEVLTVLEFDHGRR